MPQSNFAIDWPDEEDRVMQSLPRGAFDRPHAAMRAQSKARGRRWIYVGGEREFDGLTKIGIAWQPDQRCWEQGLDLLIAFTLPDGAAAYDLEQEIHDRLFEIGKKRRRLYFGDTETHILPAAVAIRYVRMRIWRKFGEVRVATRADWFD